MAQALDEILISLPAERRVRIAARTAELAETVESLRALRRAAGLTQAEIAAALGQSQAAVSKLEAASDMLISTLRRYLAGMGYELELVLKAPNGRELRLEALTDMLDDGTDPRADTTS